jgi:hypothetical protein
MKRNPILVLGLGVLLSFGAFGVGCSDDTPAKPPVDGGSTDAKKDTGSTGGTTGSGGATASGGAIGTGGATSAGGALGTGGGIGTGGVLGTGGSGLIGTGGSLGTGGATGTGGTKIDGGADAFVRLDSSPVDGSKVDVNEDVPNINHDGGIDGGSVALDGAHLDSAIDVATVNPVDAAIDSAILDAELVDGGLDSSSN